MKLDKENTKQIIKIVVIAIVLLVALLNIEPVWNVFKTFLSILSPFIWGLAIAFILNIFMRFYEEKLFKTKAKTYNKSTKKSSISGIKEIDKKELAKYFIEFRPYLNKCEYGDCSHIKEEKCAVKEAVQQGKISKARYERYCKLWNEYVSKY